MNARSNKSIEQQNSPLSQNCPPNCTMSQTCPQKSMLSQNCPQNSILSQTCPQNLPHNSKLSSISTKTIPLWCYIFILQLRQFVETACLVELSSVPNPTSPKRMIKFDCRDNLWTICQHSFSPGMQCLFSQQEKFNLLTSHQCYTLQDVHNTCSKPRSCYFPLETHTWIFPLNSKDNTMHNFFTSRCLSTKGTNLETSGLQQALAVTPY